jgi:hypothetical protein
MRPVFVVTVTALLLAGAATAVAGPKSRANPLAQGLAAAAGHWTAVPGAPVIGKAIVRNAGSTTYTDPSGDSGSAPDITTVTVSNDDVPVVTVAVTTPNRPALTDGDIVSVLLDTDRSSSTGYMGFEKVLLLGQTDTTQRAMLCPWSSSPDSSACVSVTASHSGGVATFTLRAADAGITTGFSFLVLTLNGYSEDVDYAPDSPPGWAYTIQTGTPPPPAPLPPPVNPGETVYTDPAGDSLGGPDITTVTVSNDATGLITLKVNVTGLDVGETDMYTFLNTDRNTDTGSASGCEYTFDVDSQAGSHDWGMTRWSGDDWQDVPRSSTMSFNHTGDVATFTFHRSDIGNVGSFDFWIAADSDSGGPDFAPPGVMWTYTLSATTATLVAGKVVASPAKPVAGKRLVVSMPVTRSDTGQAPADPKLTYLVTVAGKAVKATGSIVGKTARVTTTVPRSAKGKVLRVRLTVTAQGLSATGTVSYRVA